MKIRYLFYIVLFFASPLYQCQHADPDYEQIEGSWKGNFKDSKNLYPVNLEISKSSQNKNSYQFIFNNFNNEKFYVTKSRVKQDSPKKFTFTIEEAGLSYCANCKFTEGKVILTIMDDQTIKLSILSVGPMYWRSYDVQEGMPDISGLVLMKDRK
ncbi:hypothetical protein [uncultured Chryseobacterium sp.]|uniref:hypothetical protein n=1 Tax=uncultured Chryseobacterium sp. TaxID=259322 RepID=UPI0025EFA0D7|nr:hypothetical protein [uncultured Chryseobacterium sp.]